MYEVRYKMSSLTQELQQMLQLAAQFLEPAGPQPDQILHPLQNERTDRQFPWRVTPDNPIRTVATRAYQGKGKGDGQILVFGELSFIFIGQAVPAQSVAGKTAGKGARRDIFRITENASMLVQIRDENKRVVARWNFDVAHAEHPSGPVFHVDLASDEFPMQDGIMAFPKALPIPRFLSCVCTPGEALDFMLYELFQEKWDRIRSAGAGMAVHAISGHRRRCSEMLKGLAAAAQEGGWSGVKSTRDVVANPL
jgi:hypothetical protein